MGLLTTLKEKTVKTRSADGSRLNEKELQNLDALIEDLFRLDDQKKTEKKKEKPE